MRCFVALDLPDDVRQACVAAAAPLRNVGEVKWVAPELLHVTLSFLGEIDDRQAAAIGAVVQQPWPPLRLELHGLGQFPKYGSPRVLWAGLRGDVGVLATMAQRIEAAARAVHVPPDDKKFFAHITLGRSKSPFGGARLQSAVRKQADSLRGPSFVGERVVLCRSELDSGGARYTGLAEGRCG